MKTYIIIVDGIVLDEGYGRYSLAEEFIFSQKDMPNKVDINTYRSLEHTYIIKEIIIN